MQIGQITNTYTNPLMELGLGASLAKRLLEGAKLDPQKIKKIISKFQAGKELAKANALIQDNNPHNLLTSIKELADPQAIKARFAKLQEQIETMGQYYQKKKESLTNKIFQTLKHIKYPNSSKIQSLLNHREHFQDYSYDKESQRYRWIESNINRENAGLSQYGSATDEMTDPLDIVLYHIDKGQVVSEELEHLAPIVPKKIQAAAVKLVADNIHNCPGLLGDYTSPEKLAWDNSVYQFVPGETARREQDLQRDPGNKSAPKSSKEIRARSIDYEREKLRTETEAIEAEVTEDKLINSSIDKLDQDQSNLIRFKKTGKKEEVSMKLLFTLNRESLVSRVNDLKQLKLKQGEYADKEIYCTDYYLSPHEYSLELASGQKIIVLMDLTDIDLEAYLDLIKPITTKIDDASKKILIRNKQYFVAEVIDSRGAKRIVVTGQAI